MTKLCIQALGDDCPGVSIAESFSGIVLRFRLLHNSVYRNPALGMRAVASCACGKAFLFRMRFESPSPFLRCCTLISEGALKATTHGPRISRQALSLIFPVCWFFLPTTSPPLTVSDLPSLDGPPRDPMDAPIEILFRILHNLKCLAAILCSWGFDIFSDWSQCPLLSLFVAVQGCRKGKLLM
jgi:hypothetical protein